MLIDFTEKELLVIGKILAYVATNKTINSIMGKAETHLGFLGPEEWETVKFYNEDTHAEIQECVYIKIEETV